MHLSAPELSQILEYLPRDCARLLVPDGAAEYSSRNQAEAGLTWTAIPIDVAQTKFLRPIRETIEIQVLSVEETGLHEGENGLLQHTHSRFQFAVVNLSWIPQAQPRPDRGRNHESHMTLVVFKSSRFGLGCQVCSHRQTSPWSSSSWSCFSFLSRCQLPFPLSAQIGILVSDQIGPHHKSLDASAMIIYHCFSGVGLFCGHCQHFRLVPQWAFWVGKPAVDWRSTHLGLIRQGMVRLHNYQQMNFWKNPTKLRSDP